MICIDCGRWVGLRSANYKTCSNSSFCVPDRIVSCFERVPMQSRYHDSGAPAAALTTTGCREAGHMARPDTTEGRTLWQPGAAEEGCCFRAGVRHLHLLDDGDDEEVALTSFKTSYVSAKSFKEGWGLWFLKPCLPLTARMTRLTSVKTITRRILTLTKALCKS